MRVLNRLPAESETDLLHPVDDLGSRAVDLGASATDEAAPPTRWAGHCDLSSPTEVSRLLLWALDHDVLTRDEGALAYRATISADTSSQAALKQLANDAGVTTRAMRARYTRVVDKLARAVLHTT